MASRWVALLVLAVITVAAGLPGVMTLPPMDRDEARFAQATAQMIRLSDGEKPACLTEDQAHSLAPKGLPEAQQQTANDLSRRIAGATTLCFQDEQRNKKPIGIHWLQATAVQLFAGGNPDNIWVYRLPSLLGAILAVWGCYAAGCSLLGRRAAFFGAALLAPTIVLGIEANLAKTDAMLAGATTLAMAALARLYVARPVFDETGMASERPRLRGAAMGFWLAMALGVLVKGVTPLVAGLTILAIALMDRDVRWLRPALWWPAILAFLVITAPWFILINVFTEGQWLLEALGQDAGGKIVSTQEQHGGPFGYHLGVLALGAFPMIILVLPGLTRALGAAFTRRAIDRPGLRFLLAWLVPTWLFFELLPTKLAHYTLPIYPALALMAGAVLAAIVERRANASTWLMSFVSALVFAVSAAALALAVIILPAISTVDGFSAIDDAPMSTLQQILGDFEDSLSTFELAGAIALGMGLVAAPFMFLVARAPRAFLAVVIAPAIAWHIVALQYVAPKQQDMFTSAKLDQVLEGMVLHPVQHDTPPILISGYTEPSLVFLLGGKVELLPGDASPSEIACRAVEKRDRAIIVPEAIQDAVEDEVVRLGGNFVTPKPDSQLTRPGSDVIEGINYSRGDVVSLVIFDNKNPVPDACAPDAAPEETAAPRPAAVSAPTPTN